MSTMSKSKHEQLLAIKTAYLAEHGPGPVSPREMGEWAVKNKLYALPAFAAAKRCAEELSEAMRTEYLTDEHGHRVRVMHPKTDGQGTFWDDIRRASREHMEVSCAQRRDGIVGDVKQLKTDINFYNRLHRDEPRLQLSFNFTNDLADAGLLDDGPASLDVPTAGSPTTPPATPPAGRGAAVPPLTPTLVTPQPGAAAGDGRVVAPRKRAAARAAVPAGVASPAAAEDVQPAGVTTAGA